jgi:hypothetical protein
MNIKIENVMQVYSGKSGCMCGCNGKYKIPTHMREVADKTRGYPHSDEDVSDIAVKRMFNRFMKEINSWKIDMESRCVYRDNGSRNNVIYFKD